MAKISFTKLGLKPNYETVELALNDATTLEVRTYLPIAEKVKLIEFVVSNALDEKTGRFSPVRTEVYFAIGLVKWYGNVTFTDTQMRDIMKTYDALETNGVIGKITSVIPEAEYEFMSDLIKDTASDIADYNSSFAGILSAAAGEASSLNEQATKLLESIKNREGLEVLAPIKDMVGTD